MKIPTSEEFLNMQGMEQEELFKLAIVKNSKILFDDETIPSEKEYKKLNDVSLNDGDRVLLIKISGTFVILGKIN